MNLETTRPPDFLMNNHENPRRRNQSKNPQAHTDLPRTISPRTYAGLAMCKRVQKTAADILNGLGLTPPAILNAIRTAGTFRCPPHHTATHMDKQMNKTTTTPKNKNPTTTRTAGAELFGII